MHWNRIITAQWEEMGDVGSMRYEPALLLPCLTIRVLTYITVTVRDPPTQFVSECSEILQFKT